MEEIKKENSTLIQHKIAVEDDERKFTHENTYKSCCLIIDKRAATFFIGSSFCALVLLFCLVQLSLNPDCSTYAKYSSIMMFLVGVYIPQPQLRGN
jgi:hypothetical protein